MENVVVTPNPQATSPAVIAPAPVATPTPPVQADPNAAPVQHSLADAQLTGPVVMPQVTPPPAPVTPAAPVTPVSPASDPVAEQRVKDAQRKMHESTAEASKLRSQLHTILNHPQLGPVVNQIVNPVTGIPRVDENDPVKKAWKAYQEAPNDEEAFRVLLGVTEQRARDRVVNEMTEMEIQRTNKARAAQKDTLIAQAINREVSEKANDVPLELFWAMSTRAEMETPQTLLTLPEKLEWQIQRSVELAREVLNSKANAAVAAQAQSHAVRQTAAPVMAPGSAGTVARGTVGGTQKTFVDSIREAQARKITS